MSSVKDYQEKVVQILKDRFGEEWLEDNIYPYSNCINIEKKLKQAYIAGFEKGYNYAREELLNEGDVVTMEVKNDI